MTRRALAPLLVFVCALGTVHAEPSAEDRTRALPPGTTIVIPGVPALMLDARHFLVTERGIDDANTALANEARVSRALAACVVELDRRSAQRQTSASGWRGLRWGAVGAAVVGAFALGLSL